MSGSGAVSGCEKMTGAGAEVTVTEQRKEQAAGVTEIGFSESGEFCRSRSAQFQMLCWCDRVRDSAVLDGIIS